MLYSYYVICRLTRKDRHNKFIERTIKVTARSPMGAMRNAIEKIAKSSDKEATSIRVDWQNPMPVRKPRKKKYKRKPKPRHTVVYDGLTRIR